jgi:hypothetical protein
VAIRWDCAYLVETCIRVTPLGIAVERAKVRKKLAGVLVRSSPTIWARSSSQVPQRVAPQDLLVSRGSEKGDPTLSWCSATD